MRIESSSADFPPGSVIDGRYRVVRVLGKGGMGVVLEAVHEPLGARVAIKLMGRRLAATPGFAERFLREARAASALRSDYVARVTDFGSIDGARPYMVMEHLDGEDLAQVLARGPLPIAEAVDAVLQAAAGLAEAHANGIVHRDLKPSNLFRTRRSDGSTVVKVLDFGIAKVVEPDATSALTATGQVLGTPMYMSPEQIRTPRAIDATSDVWSLGVVLFELLAGQTPFEEEEMGPMLAAILERPAPDVRTLRPDVPEPLAHLVGRALAKRRDARIASMAVLADELLPFASDEGRVAAHRARAVGRRAPSLAPPVEAATTPTLPAQGFEATTLVVDATPQRIVDGGVDARSDAGTVLSGELAAAVPSPQQPAPRPPAPIGAIVLAGLVALAVGATGMWLALRPDAAPVAPPSAAADAAERPVGPSVVPVPAATPSITSAPLATPLPAPTAPAASSGAPAAPSPATAPVPSAARSPAPSGPIRARPAAPPVSSPPSPAPAPPSEPSLF